MGEAGTTRPRPAEVVAPDLVTEPATHRAVPLPATERLPMGGLPSVRTRATTDPRTGPLPRPGDPAGGDLHMNKLFTTKS
ncbi:hypothetical protein GCM10010249_43250 [Streptomyces roseolilacinus]|uniref:Uncharacterized protein n=1 Tax=Streptomyces roseolilacinus TaxID=66904 RepID=A0A918B4Y5_9ACTN|nr:hypothetical protein GCM10010249_43250 [Streptomyces roseolilacinus]